METDLPLERSTAFIQNPLRRPTALTHRKSDTLWRASPAGAGPPGSGASASRQSSPSAELRPPPRRLCAWARRNSDQLGAHVALARVLPRQPPDQATRLGRKRQTTGPATATSAISLKQCPLPAAERPRTDRKAGPSLGREQPAHHSEQGSPTVVYCGRFPPRPRIAS
jgi:hypothetical protein